MRFGSLAALTVTLAFAATASGAAPQPKVMLYDTPASHRAIIAPGAPDALPVDGRLFVPGRAKDALFAGDADKPYRVDNIVAADLIKQRTAARMATYLRNRIDGNACTFSWGRVDCRSGLVFIDEIDHRFAEKAPNLNTAAWKRKRGGKYPTYRPKLRAGQPGYELAKAMVMLSKRPHRRGGTYADRVHFFIAPGMVTSLGVGKGPLHNLGRDGRPHFRTYEGVRGALQRAGGVWLEMYHFSHGHRDLYAFTTAEWQAYPNRFALYLSGRGKTKVNTAYRAKMRFQISAHKPKVKGGAPAACRTGSAMTCVFTLASSPVNKPILQNGLGLYRMKGQEAVVRTHIKHLYFPELLGR